LLALPAKRQESEREVTRPVIPRSPNSTLKVLVVDDNADALMLMTLRLRRLGHDVRQAADGQSALQTAAEYQPDVVLMDLAMPGIDGHSTARALRQLEQGQSMLLIALTGYDDPDIRRRSEAAGFDHHVVKPIETAHLRELLSDRLCLGA
jgi:CheY-like chemotaxis protein